MNEELTMKEFIQMKEDLSVRITELVRADTNEFTRRTGVLVKSVVMTRYNEELCPANIDVDLKL